jgi:ABC-type glutathione transport system ATPase component
MADNLQIHEAARTPLLQVQSLSKHYLAGGRWFNRVPVTAVDNVNFLIGQGQTLGLVGSSGSGKSTVARCVTGLEQPDSGHIWFEGVDLARLTHSQLRCVRLDVQMIFQDAVTSLNPRFSALEAVEEPLQIQGKARSERREVAETVVKEVGLSPAALGRRVMEFSGGQRQRLAIARALTMRPKLLVLDEAFSGLDLSTQAQIANLLLDLQATHGLSYLLISHDIALVAGMADAIAVMAHGRLVESGDAQRVVGNPQHEETRKLLTSTRTMEAGLALRAGASG